MGRSPLALPLPFPPPFSTVASSTTSRAPRQSRGGDRLIKRICAKLETQDKASALYDSLKDTDLHSKNGISIVCAYVASEM